MSGYVQPSGKNHLTKIQSAIPSYAKMSLNYGWNEKNSHKPSFISSICSKETISLLELPKLIEKVFLDSFIGSDDLISHESDSSVW